MIAATPCYPALDKMRACLVAYVETNLGVPAHAACSRVRHGMDCVIEITDSYGETRCIDARVREYGPMGKLYQRVRFTHPHACRLKEYAP